MDEQGKPLKRNGKNGKRNGVAATPMGNAGSRVGSVVEEQAVYVPQLFGEE